MSIFCFSALGRKVNFNSETITPPSIDESLYPNISSLALDVAGRCNLKCAYCAERLTMPKRKVMSTKVIDESLEAFFKWANKKGELSIHTGSGESLLAPDSVRRIGMKAKSLARERGQPLSLYLTTNGTLLSNKITRWLINDGWNVKVSLDGNQEIQDSYRTTKSGAGTFKAIEPFVRQMAQKIPDRFSTTSVLCSGTDPEEVFKSITSLGVRKIELLPVAAANNSKLTLTKKDIDAYRRFIFNYADQISRGKNLPTHIRFHNRLLNAMGYRNERIPCGAGRTFFAIDFEGTIFPCIRFVGIQKYRLGNLGGIDLKRTGWFIKNAGRSYESRSECAKCWAAPMCGGPCYACADLIGGGSPQPSYCEIIKLESMAALWLIDYLKHSNVEKLVEILITNYRAE